MRSMPASDLAGFKPRRVHIDDLHGVTVMGVRRFELTRSSALVKRAFDLLGASLGLLAVSPLLAVIAVAIKLDSRGPVFFASSGWVSTVGASTC